MGNGRPAGRAGAQAQALSLVSFLACLFVANRLWTTNRQLSEARLELARVSAYRRAAAGGGPATASRAAAAATHAAAAAPVVLPAATSDADVMFYSIRPAPAGPLPPLEGARLGEPGEPTVAPAPLPARDDALLGQIDTVEEGAVTGWACVRGHKGAPVPVSIYVDGVHVGDAPASGDAPHQVVQRLCGGDAADAATATGADGVAFRAPLPALSPGRHEVRAFATRPGAPRATGQELSQSPLPFLETAAHPAPAEALRRKDAIIRVRNAQVSALWDELHTRQPWRNALGGGKDGGAPISLDAALGAAAAAAAANTSRPVVVIGVNTGLGARARRDNLRATWVPAGAKLAALERDHGVVIRFVVGRSDQKDDPEEARLAEEAAQFGDILRLDMVDTYADLSLKTLTMFSVLPTLWDADFYFKIDDDVAVNVPALAAYLAAQRGRGNLYLGCMKSGQVLTDRRYKWFEGESWKFGEPATVEGAINYPRHASGQVYGLSGPIARYIARAAPVLHRYANEDVTVGTWLLGLDVKHVDERRLCCDSAERCAAQTAPSNVCLSYYEHQCAGICTSETRLVPIYKSCLDDPLSKNPADLGKGITDWDEGMEFLDDDEEEDGD